jgi:hypothetical protein
MARVNVTDMAVAQAALVAMLSRADLEDSVQTLADQLISAASKVRFQPSTRQLVLTFDLTFGVTDTDPGSGPVE